MNESKNLDILTSVLGQPQKPHNPIDRNGNAYFHCPFCNHKNKKLTVNLTKGLWNCFVCEMRGRSLSRLMIKLGRHAEAKLFGTRKSYDLDNLFGDKKVEEEIVSVDLPKSYNPIFNNLNKVFYRPAIDYLQKRGMETDDFLRYDIHYNIVEQRVLFPSYDEVENLNYYVSRSIRPDEKMKYKNATVAKKNVIFNEHLIDWSKELFLVEGVFDAIISRKNAVPILGSSINEGFKLFRKVIKNKTDVVLALDADARKKTLSIADKFSSYDINVRFIDWVANENRDIAEMGSDEFDKIATSGALRNVEFKDQIKERLFS